MLGHGRGVGVACSPSRRAAAPTRSTCSTTRPAAVRAVQVQDRGGHPRRRRRRLLEHRQGRGDEGRQGHGRHRHLPEQRRPDPAGAADRPTRSTRSPTASWSRWPTRRRCAPRCRARSQAGIPVIVINSGEAQSAELRRADLHRLGRDGRGQAVGQATGHRRGQERALRDPGGRQRLAREPLRGRQAGSRSARSTTCRSTTTTCRGASRSSRPSCSRPADRRRRHPRRPGRRVAEQAITEAHSTAKLATFDLNADVAKAS